MKEVGVVKLTQPSSTTLFTSLAGRPHLLLTPRGNSQLVFGSGGRSLSSGPCERRGKAVRMAPCDETSSTWEVIHLPLIH